MSDEFVTVRRLAGSDLELLQVQSLRQSFGRHTHDSVSIGVIDRGVGEFWCRGATHRVPPDSVVLIDPGEVHTGGVARGHDALAYRMVYVPLAAARGLTPDGWWPFSTPAAFAPRLAATARRLHLAATGGGSLLACESALCDLLTATASSPDGEVATRGGRRRQHHRRHVRLRGPGALLDHVQTLVRHYARPLPPVRGTVNVIIDRRTTCL